MVLICEMQWGSACNTVGARHLKQHCAPLLGLFDSEKAFKAGEDQRQGESLLKENKSDVYWQNGPLI